MAHFPDKYGANYLYLLEVDLKHVHAFWEIAPNSVPEKILDKSWGKADLCLKVFYDYFDDRSEGRSVSCDIPAKGLINDWFVELKDQPTTCHVELGYYAAGQDLFIPVCRSNIIKSVLRPNIDDKRAEKGDTVSHTEAEDQGKGKGQERDKVSSLMESISREDVEDYYRSLSDRLVSPRKVSPWRSILDSLSSDTVSLKGGANTGGISVPLDFSFEDPSSDDIFSSNLTSIDT